jgi:hypothetical protein
VKQDDVKRILETIKVDDGHILLGEPVTITKYGREITIGQINWFYRWEKFSLYMGLFLSYFGNVCEKFRLPTSLADVEAMRDNFRLTITNKVWGYRAFKELCNLCGLFGIKKAWAKKAFNIDDWFEVFLYVYLYNLIGVKRRLVRRVRPDFQSPVHLDQTKGDIYATLHKELGFSEDEIKKLTTLQVNLHLQRFMEPQWKSEIDQELLKATA